jgi:hypothetical protein
MPSKSKAQHNLMAAVAHNKAFAKKVGIPQSVGKEFNDADKGKKFRSGGMAKKEMHSEKSEMKMDKAQDKAMIQKAFRQHDMQEHKGGKGTTLKLAKGGMDMKKKSVNPAMAMMAARAMRTPAAPAMKPPMAAPMAPPTAPMGMGMKSGGRTPPKGDHPVQKQAKHGAKIIKMASGGLAAGHKSANGCAVKGLTKGKQVKMRSGGMC